MNTVQLTQLRLIRLTGSDTQAFLQSQLTAQLSECDSLMAYPAAWCNSKGRVITTLLVSIEGSSASLVVPTNLADQTVARLNMFRIGRDVEIHSPQLVEGAHRHTGDPYQQDQWMMLAFDQDRAIRLASESTHLPSTGSDHAWQKADLAHGWVWLTAETSEQFLPQMLGLEALDGISYRKGCYPGQEIIARLHYRGRLTKRLMRYEYSAEQVLNPGSTLELNGSKVTILTALSTDTEPSDNATSSQGLAVVPVEITDHVQFDIQPGRVLFFDV